MHGVIHLFPFYAEWNDILLHSINRDFAHCRCDPEQQPCKYVQRLLVILKFYEYWLPRNLNDDYSPKQKYHVTNAFFLNNLQEYSTVMFENDYQHFIQWHVDNIKPVNYLFVLFGV